MCDSKNLNVSDVVLRAREVDDAAVGLPTAGCDAYWQNQFRRRGALSI
jgi:hypothetical protein